MWGYGYVMQAVYYDFNKCVCRLDRLFLLGRSQIIVSSVSARVQKNLIYRQTPLYTSSRAPLPLSYPHLFSLIRPIHPVSKHKHSSDINSSILHICQSQSKHAKSVNNFSVNHKSLGQRFAAAYFQFAWLSNLRLSPSVSLSLSFWPPSPQIHQQYLNCQSILQAFRWMKCISNKRYTIASTPAFRYFN